MAALGTLQKACFYLTLPVISTRNRGNKKVNDKIGHVMSHLTRRMNYYTYFIGNIEITCLFLGRQHQMRQISHLERRHSIARCLEDVELCKIVILTAFLTIVCSGTTSAYSVLKHWYLAIYTTIPHNIGEFAEGLIHQLSQ